MLFHGWEIVDAFGWDWKRLDLQANFRHSYEPIFVLKNVEHSFTPQTEDDSNVKTAINEL